MSRCDLKYNNKDSIDLFFAFLINEFCGPAVVEKFGFLLQGAAAGLGPEAPHRAGAALFSVSGLRFTEGGRSLLLLLLPASCFLLPAGDVCPGVDEGGGAGASLVVSAVNLLQTERCVCVCVCVHCC